MIIKSHETRKINLKTNPFILLYGKNEGLKKETLSILLKAKQNSSTYEEKEILDNSNNFLENIFSKSLFESEKIIIIKRATDKITKVISEIIEKKINDIILIINSETLEKKSKLRSFFEKNKTCICVPFYPDDEQTLSKLAYSFLRQKQIKISPSCINLIVNKVNGDRQTLTNELNKIDLLSKSKKIITEEDIIKIINLAENHSISELIDNCLIKNKKKIMKILNENNFSNEDSILIIKSFINKLKKLLRLCNEFEKNKDVNLTILSAKPPIFWKDKEITKRQILQWKPKRIKKTIYELNNLELDVKKNITFSVQLITDFVLDQSTAQINN